MNSKKAVEVIRKLLESKERKCILVSGEWGIGKTYSISNTIKLRNDDFKYTTLFGKDDIKKVEKDLIIQIEFNINDKKKGSTKKRIFQEGVKKIAENYNINFDLDAYLENIGIETLEEKENVLICIDDIERKLESISIQEVLGLAERISMKFNLVIIGNFSKLTDEEKKKFDEFKEKVVDYEILIDDIHDDQLEGIVKASFNEEYNLISKYRIQHIMNEFKKSEYKNNIRIFKKVIDLLKRVNEEVSLIMNNKKFWLDERFISSCYKVITKYYIDKNMVYEEIDHEIDKIYRYDKCNDYRVKAYFQNKKEVHEDSKKLLNAYTLNRYELKDLIEKILKKIDKCDREYFSCQEDVIPIFEALQYVNSETNDINIEEIYNKLFNIAKEIYSPKLDGNIAVFTPLYVSMLYEKTNKMVQELQGENIELYVKFVKENMRNSLEKKDYEKYKEVFFYNLNIINNLEKDIDNFWKEEFEKLLKKINEEFSKNLWACIEEIVREVGISIIDDYIEKNKELNLLTRFRIKKLNEILNDEFYDNDIYEEFSNVDSGVIY